MTEAETYLTLNDALTEARDWPTLELIDGATPDRVIAIMERVFLRAASKDDDADSEDRLEDCEEGRHGRNVPPVRRSRYQDVQEEGLGTRVPQHHHEDAQPHRGEDGRIVGEAADGKDEDLLDASEDEKHVSLRSSWSNGRVPRTPTRQTDSSASFSD